MADAGRRVYAALAMLKPRQQKLLVQLIEPTIIDGPPLGRWQVVVALVTGLKDDEAQGRVVREAAGASAARY